MCENLNLFEHFPPIIYTQFCWRPLFWILAFRCEIGSSFGQKQFLSDLNAITEVIFLDRLIRMTEAGLEADQVTEVSFAAGLDQSTTRRTSKRVTKTWHGMTLTSRVSLMTTFVLVLGRRRYQRP